MDKRNIELINLQLGVLSVKDGSNNAVSVNELCRYAIGVSHLIECLQKSIYDFVDTTVVLDDENKFIFIKNAKILEYEVIDSHKKINEVAINNFGQKLRKGTICNNMLIQKIKKNEKIIIKLRHFASEE